jgi:hypothetical protein
MRACGSVSACTLSSRDAAILRRSVHEKPHIGCQKEACGMTPRTPRAPARGTPTPLTAFERVTNVKRLTLFGTRHERCPPKPPGIPRDFPRATNLHSWAGRAVSPATHDILRLSLRRRREHGQDNPVGVRGSEAVARTPGSGRTDCRQGVRRDDLPASQEHPDRREARRARDRSPAERIQRAFASRTCAA